MFFCESLLFRTCETKVLSKLAIHEPRIADASHLFGGLIQHAMRPHLSVEAIEDRQHLRLVLKKDFAVWRRLYSHSSNYRRQKLRAFVKRKSQSNLCQRDAASDETFERGQCKGEIGQLGLREAAVHLNAVFVGDGVGVYHIFFAEIQCGSVGFGK